MTEQWICILCGDCSVPGRPDSDERCWIALKFHQGLQGGDPSHWTQGLWPFLSRHLWDRETVDKLMVKQQRGRWRERGSKVGMARWVFSILRQWWGKGLVGEEDRVGNNGRISFSSENFRPEFSLSSSLMNLRRNSICLIQNVVPAPPETSGENN